MLHIAEVKHIFNIHRKKYIANRWVIYWCIKEISMEYRVKEYIKPGMTDSEAIRAVLAESASDTGRTIIFEGKDFFLSEAVILPSDTTVIIDGCTLKQNDCTFDNIFRGDNLDFAPQNPYGYAVAVRPLKNIRIIGKNHAALIGPDRNRFTQDHPACGSGEFAIKLHMEMTGDYWGWRSHQLHFANCDGIGIEGLSVAKTRGWAMTFSFCSRVMIHDIHFDTHVKNGDGIDFRAGCHHCEVWNITGYNSDDTVACTAVAPAGYDTPEAEKIPLPGIYPGEPARLILGRDDLRKMDIHDIKIHDMNISGCFHGVICLAAGGLQVYNIAVSNIVEAAERSWPLVEIYTGYGSGYAKGDLHDITVENITAATHDRKDFPRAAITVKAGVKNVSIKNVAQKGTAAKYEFSDPEGINVDE